MQAEVAEVKKTLDEVTKECTTVPGNDDSIFKLIEKTGNMLNDAWNVATNAYQDAWEKVSDGIDYVIKKGKEIDGYFDEFATKHR